MPPHSPEGGVVSKVSDNVIVDTRLDGLELRSRGKVRDIYEVDGMLLIVTTDRISAFDVVLPTGIRDKGKVLNQLSLYWFERTRGIVPNHVIEGDFDRFPARLKPFENELRARSMLVRKLTPVPFECVVRGYLYGSGWKEYQKTGSVCGIPLSKGMRLADRFEEPLFTPSTKAESGHDVNVSEDDMARSLGAERTKQLKEISLALYRLGSAEAEARGIIIADTKFELGHDPQYERALPHRRGDDAGFVALLAEGPLPSRPGSAELRQAIRARVSGTARLGQDASRA